MFISPRKLILLVGAVFLFLPVCAVDGRLEGILDGSMIRKIRDFLRSIRNQDADSGSNEDESTNSTETKPTLLCNKVVCSEGEFCCNESCSVCVKEGDSCTEQFCMEEPEVDGTDGDEDIEEDDGIPCNKATCAVGEYCCNESCSVCVKEGDSCTLQFCVDEIVCGNTTCADGEYCCNESCGICVKEGDACTEQFCMDEPGVDGEDGTWNQDFECKVDSDCSPINCIKAPCPQPTCIENKCVIESDVDGGTSCGPTVCTSDEICCNDFCGVCGPIGEECPMVKCSNPNEGVCGNATCGADEYCCNESCGICAKDGDSCTEQFCMDEPGVNGEDGSWNQDFECKIDSDCSPINCIQAPCPQPTCIENKCVIESDVDAGTSCGPTVCTSDEVCCNDFCGVCGPIGAECPMVKCSNPNEGVCGNATCGADEYCCNESCGICAAIGTGCNKMLCVDEENP